MHARGRRRFAKACCCPPNNNRTQHQHHATLKAHRASLDSERLPVTPKTTTQPSTSMRLRTGPALTRKGRLAMYRLSAHSLCTRKSERAKLPTSMPSPMVSRLRGKGGRGGHGGQISGLPETRQSCLTAHAFPHGQQAAQREAVAGSGMVLQPLWVVWQAGLGRHQCPACKLASQLGCCPPPTQTSPQHRCPLTCTGPRMHGRPCPLVVPPSQWLPCTAAATRPPPAAAAHTVPALAPACMDAGREANVSDAGSDRHHRLAACCPS